MLYLHNTKCLNKGENQNQHITGRGSGNTLKRRLNHKEKKKNLIMYRKLRAEHPILGSKTDLAVEHY